jgi:uncharacterized protein (TIGR00369 family)
MSAPEPLRQLFERDIPFHRRLGLRLLRASAEGVELQIPWDADLVGDVGRPAWHGGVLSTLADAAGGCAVFAAQGLEARVSTVDLRVDYLQPAGPELPLHAEARLLRLGGRVAVAEVELHQGDPRRRVARATAVYSVYPPRGSP